MERFIDVYQALSVSHPLPLSHPRDQKLLRSFLTRWWPLLQASVPVSGPDALEAIAPRSNLHPMRDWSWWINPPTSLSLGQFWGVFYTVSQGARWGWVPVAQNANLFINIHSWPFSLSCVTSPLLHHASLDRVPPKLLAFKSSTWGLLGEDLTVRHCAIRITRCGGIQTDKGEVGANLSGCPSHNGSPTYHIYATALLLKNCSLPKGNCLLAHSDWLALGMWPKPLIILHTAATVTGPWKEHNPHWTNQRPFLWSNWCYGKRTSFLPELWSYEPSENWPHSSLSPHREAAHRDRG